MALYVGHHGWPTKKILGFRWSRKAKITLKTISFWQNIYISIFAIFSNFRQWNLVNFSRFANALIRTEKKNTYAAVNEKRKTVISSWTLFYNRLFYKVLWSRILTFRKTLRGLLHWKHFKNDEECFLFHLKSYFGSQDI